MQYLGLLARCSVTPENVKSRLLTGRLRWEPAKDKQIWIFLQSSHAWKHIFFFFLTACVMWGSILNSLLVESRTSHRKVARSNPGLSGGRIFFSRQLSVLTLIRCPFHPRVTIVARKRPRPFCQKCRWQITPKHAYILDRTKSEWADYASVQAYFAWIRVYVTSTHLSILRPVQT